MALASEMEALMSTARVAEMTVDELKHLVREVTRQTVVEILADPDEGLELRDEMKARLRTSLGAAETMTAADVAARLGLEW